MTAEKPLLTDPRVSPSPAILKSVLGASYDIYKRLMDTISEQPFHVVYEWKYYHDGKAWLCKATFKNKTVFWLSAWNGYFKISFYFTARNAEDIAGLPISKKNRDAFIRSVPIGKLIPLVLVVKDEKHTIDAVELIRYKKGKL